MIKAVFFDLYNTLVRFEPPREQMELEMFREAGIQVDLGRLKLGLYKADEYYMQENARSRVEQRSPQDKMAVYARYQAVVIQTAGGKVPPQDVLLKLLLHWRQARMKTVLYDDVLLALDGLKARGLKLGLISNVDRDVSGMFSELGLASRLDVIMTPQEAGADKPQPAIFLAALARAGVGPQEGLHVGDQFEVDARGALGAGMKALLLDRDNLFPEVTDCPRIHSLAQVADYVV